jgi:hypothetical protein
MLTVYFIPVIIAKTENFYKHIIAVSLLSLQTLLLGIFYYYSLKKKKKKKQKDGIHSVKCWCFESRSN